MFDLLTLIFLILLALTALTWAVWVGIKIKLWCLNRGENPNAH